MQRKNKFTELVINSGGAKGSVYPGAIKAIYDLGLDVDLEKSVGSSAGAITAILLAIHVDFDVLYKYLLETDYQSQLGKFVGSFWHITGTAEGNSVIARDALPLEETYRELILNEMLAFFNSEEGKTLVLKPEIATIAKRLREDTQNFFLGDLNYLHKAYPEKFKNVSLLTVAYPDARPVVLSSELTPEVEIAKAAHASCAVPVLSSTVKLQVNGVEEILFDGGFSRFLPVELCNPDTTLVLAISNHRDKKQTAIYKALHHNPPYYTPPFIEKITRQYAPRLFAGITAPKNTVEYWEENYELLSKYDREQVVILDTHEVIQNEFGKAEFWCKELTWLGYYDLLIHFYKKKIELPHATINIEVFLNTLACHFISIYKALLLEANIDIHRDKLFLQLVGMNNAYEMCKFLRFEIRMNATEELDSLPAFAFSRAIEFINEKINSDDLFKECYARIHFPECFTLSLDITGFFVKNINDKRNILKRQDLNEIVSALKKLINFETMPFKLMIDELNAENKSLDYLMREYKQENNRPRYATR